MPVRMSRGECLVSSNFDVKALPRYRQILLFGSAAMFVALLFPWVGVSFSGQSLGSANGWNGLGTFIGFLVIILIAWEVLRSLGMLGQINVSHDLVSAGLAALIALFCVIQFFRAFSSGWGLAGGGTYPHIGAYLGLVLAAALAYAAVTAFRTAGGAAAVKEAQSRLTGDAQDTSAPPEGEERPPQSGS